MRVLAACLIGLSCTLVAGALMGSLPNLQLPSLVFAPRRARNRLWLQQAGAGLTPTRFWAGSAAAGLLALLVLVALTGSLFVALVPSVAVALFPRGYFARRRRLRMREVQAAWPDGLRDVVASISAGRSLTQAVNALAATGPPALREAFARFPELARVLGTGPALELVKEELADPTSDRVLEVLFLAHERGGPIVRSILEDLVDATTRLLGRLGRDATANAAACASCRTRYSSGVRSSIAACRNMRARCSSPRDSMALLTCVVAACRAGPNRRGSVASMTRCGSREARGTGACPSADRATTT